MGATVGRVANRINKARFTVDGETFNIRSQSSDYALHGGIRGFDKVCENTFIFYNIGILKCITLF